MKIIIEIPENLDPESVLNYFYAKCLDLYVINEISDFKLEIEGTEFKQRRRK